MLSAPSQFAAGGAKEGRFWSVFFPSLTAMVGFWATLSLNIPDFTRYARDQRAQVLGQALGLPLTMTLFSFIGIAVTSATTRIYGEAIWDPIALLGRIEGGFAVALSLVALSVATLTTNIAANVVSPANAFVNADPRRITFRTGGCLTAGLGIAMMPWKLLESTQQYVYTWLIGYSALLGPIAGILIADYFVLRRARLDLESLYRRDGCYAYVRGVNPVAMAALLLGVLPSLPGFLHAAGAVRSVPAVLGELYRYAWFVGLAVAAVVYVAGMRGSAWRRDSRA
jgi:NCS1 family nucleobase:cation symporter-1